MPALLLATETWRVRNPDNLRSILMEGSPSTSTGNEKELVEKAQGLSPPRCSTEGGGPHCYLFFLFLNPLSLSKYVPHKSTECVDHSGVGQEELPFLKVLTEGKRCGRNSEEVLTY